MKISARNQFKGTVKEIERGPVSAEVVVDLGGGTEITAIITRKSADNLNLAPGKEAYVVIKATEVIVGID
ncbi:TOBE domain-containing protein [Methanoculleus sp. FWC-SCC1]|uniref:TOBE domain-containing protein n=1 Tax=Methanoculleus frigidifontis TaxID=2584085 RepID=A0ABT8MA69_9EURY|nr:TOBE domain-containing protein [Methanoculleus sp. FWC-SCC1]MDN7024828.1 TOBE domain-containing protein [Methanoculleus sp. FWC-SCC1]